MEHLIVCPTCRYEIAPDGTPYNLGRYRAVIPCDDHDQLLAQRAVDAAQRLLRQTESR